MLLSRIAPDYSGAMVRTSHICAQNLFWKRLVKVYEQVLVKLKELIIYMSEFICYFNGSELWYEFKYIF